MPIKRNGIPPGDDADTGAVSEEPFQQSASEARPSRLCRHDDRAEKGVVGSCPFQPGSAEQPAVYFCHDKLCRVDVRCHPLRREELHKGTRVRRAALPDAALPEADLFHPFAHPSSPHLINGFMLTPSIQRFTLLRRDVPGWPPRLIPLSAGFKWGDEFRGEV
jgi:hypothetical protein